jgi:sigma-E factor negative regulatory protein RseA
MSLNTGADPMNKVDPNQSLCTHDGVTTEALQRLSVVMDGEAHADEVHAACKAWRSQPQLQAQLHLYERIGDTLRSDSGAWIGASHNAPFMSGLRERLRHEPVPLAPQPAIHHRKKMSWGTTSRWAVAASVFLGAWAVVATVQYSPFTFNPVTAAATGWAGLRSDVAGSVNKSARVVEPPILRNPRLDAYLAAHQQLTSNSILGESATFLRNAVANTMSTTVPMASLYAAPPSQPLAMGPVSSR